MDNTPPAISTVPDLDTALAQFDPDAWLASPPPAEFVPPPNTSGWSIVPATVKDERGFTAEDYEEAALGFTREGEIELAAQATIRGFEMRKWLMVAQGNSRN